MDKLKVPIYHKLNLTIEEAAEYSNIGKNKLYEMTNDPKCPFVLNIGDRKRLIKRKLFDEYINKQYAI